MTIHVDNTTLSTFAQCTTKAMLLYGWHLDMLDHRANAAQAGVAVHQAMAMWFRGKSIETAREAFAAAYQQYSLDHVADGDRLAWANIDKILTYWFTQHPLEHLPFWIDPDTVELPFTVPLSPDGSIYYTGRIDALVQPRHGNKWYVLDTKTTGQPGALFERQFPMSPQLSGYCWAMEHQLGRRINGAWINQIHLDVVPSSTRTCKVHAKPYADCGLLHQKHALLGPFTRSPGELRAWHADALVLARAWQEFVQAYPTSQSVGALPQEGKWLHDACKFCQFFEFCQVGRPESQLTTHMVQRVWNPLTIEGSAYAGC